jgi:hypothetical protein
MTWRTVVLISPVFLWEASQEFAKATVATSAAMKTSKTLSAVLPTALAVGLLVGCSTHDIASVGAAPSAQTSASPRFAPNRVSSTPPTSSPNPSIPPVVARCADGDLQVTSGPLESADTLRRVVVSFRNMSPQPCTLFGYPGADLVTPAGDLVINVPRRPAAAAHLLTLHPGEAATADVQAYAIDIATGDSCRRWGSIVVTPPNDYVSHSLAADLPMCNPSVSSVD